MKMLLLFSHTLTDDQKEDAIKNLKVNNFVEMPENVQKVWSNIPPELESITDYLKPVIDWINEIKEENDYILIHGDPGATYILVNKAFKMGLIPVYATTKRVSIEEKDKDGQIKLIKMFKHVRYRKYEQ